MPVSRSVVNRTRTGQVRSGRVGQGRWLGVRQYRGLRFGIRWHIRPWEVARKYGWLLPGIRQHGWLGPGIRRNPGRRDVIRQDTSIRAVAMTADNHIHVDVCLGVVVYAYLGPGYRWRERHGVRFIPTRHVDQRIIGLWQHPQPACVRFHKLFAGIRQHRLLARVRPRAPVPRL